VWWAASKAPGGSTTRSILHKEFPIQSGARERRRTHLGFVSGLGEDAIAGVLRYRNMAGESQETPLAWVLAAFLQPPDSRAGARHALGQPVVPPPLDLIYFLRQDRD